MSAYDNPSIIKNETAQVWAQSIGNFSEAFTKSFDRARALRDARIAEDRKEKDRIQKENDELIIKKQISKDKKNLEISEKITGVREDFKLAPPDLTNTISNTYAGFLTKVADNNVLGEVTVKSKEQNDLDSKYANNVNMIMQRDKPVIGAAATQIQNYSAMAGSQTMDIAWKGNSPLDMMINRETCTALDSNNPFYNRELKPGESKRVVKEYSADPEGDAPSSKLKVTTTIGNKNDLVNLLDDFYTGPNASADIEKAIEEGVLNNKIIKEGDTYKIAFDKTIGDSWDGNFYNEIPKRTAGNLWDKDNANVLTDNNLLKPSYVTQPTKTFGKEGKIEYTQDYVYVNTPELAKDLSVYYNAEAKGLLASNLKDDQVLKGYLSNRLKTNLSVSDFRSYSSEEQEQFLADSMIELDIKERLGKQYKSRPATKEDQDNKVPIYDGMVWESMISEKQYKQRETSTGGLTANQLDKKEKYEAKVAQERAKVANTKDITAVESGDGKKRIAWDPNSKNWFLQNKTTGGWSDDLDNPAVHSKSEAAKKYLGL